MPLVFSLMLLTFALVGSTINDVNDISSTDRAITKNEHVTEAIRINFSNKSVVSEVQHTICSVKTEDFIAKAQSTASRILTGVCTSEEMTKAFSNMEKMFMERLEHVEQSLIAFIQIKFQPVARRKKSYKRSKLSPFKMIDSLFDEEMFKNYT